MTDLTPFVDIEQAVMDLLSDLAPNNGPVAPPNLAAKLPFLRIRRLGGGDDRFIDNPHVDVEAFAATRPEAYTLAEACRQLLLSYPHVTEAGVIDSVETDSGPQEVSWEDPEIRRYVATYSITARRPAAN